MAHPKERQAPATAWEMAAVRDLDHNQRLIWDPCGLDHGKDWRQFRPLGRDVEQAWRLPGDIRGLTSGQRATLNTAIKGGWFAYGWDHPPTIGRQYGCDGACCLQSAVPPPHSSAHASGMARKSRKKKNKRKQSFDFEEDSDDDDSDGAEGNYAIRIGLHYFPPLTDFTRNTDSDKETACHWRYARAKFFEIFASRVGELVWDPHDTTPRQPTLPRLPPGCDAALPYVAMENPWKTGTVAPGINLSFHNTLLACVVPWVVACARIHPCP